MILVVGSSTRMLVQSLATSHRVFSLDSYGDYDTCELAIGWKNIGNKKNEIDASKFLLLFKQITTKFSPVGWILGSGLENNSEIINNADKILFRYGISYQQMRNVRNPGFFFDTLNKLGINYPQTILSNHGRSSSKGWLWKDFHSSGGSGISRKKANKSKSQGLYLQKELIGRSLSAFFLVENNSIYIFGFCENISKSFNESPYYYHGVKGPVKLTTKVTKYIITNLNKISSEFGLLGLNGLDFIVLGEEVFILEINPRPTSALEIFEASYNCSIINLHCNVFRNTQNPKKNRQVKFFPNKFINDKVYASKVIYALENTKLDELFFERIKNMPFCRDIPRSKFFQAGDPICSIMVESPNFYSLDSVINRHEDMVLSIIKKC